ncbi:VOC family protein [Paenibacillus sp. RC67]|uniref:VOC family protein n=1 Tax=Paenibacillus sp. RC67 TaxID=3039392 RepID=UPI0024AE6C69|nr:VOC family protein [Paenibacillus sp. RC67]
MTEANEKLVERIDAVFLPVKNLEASVEWYQEVFGYKIRWKNQRMAGLAIASNCGFHLVQVKDHAPNDGYVPFNFATKNIQKLHQTLKEKGVKVTGVDSDTEFKEMKLFDFWDLDGNIINVIAI